MNLNKTVRSYEDLHSRAFQEKLSGNAGAVIIDVRTPEEFEGGKIAEAININVMDPYFAIEIASLDKQKIYFVYCRSGARSGQACALMASKGYEVYNLAGGIMNWDGEIC